MDASLWSKIVIRAGSGFVALGALLFLPAGSFDFPAAWRYLGLLASCLGVAYFALLRRRPDVVRRRIEMGEREPVQKRIVAAGLLVFVVFFALAGFDRRFGWSHVPLAVQLLSLAGFAAGYAGFLRVLAVNPWAARTIAVEPGQAVVTHGPYALVRHPMYVVMLVMYACTPTALGSWVALPLPLCVLAFLVPRIRNEEEVLRRDLPGYSEYTATVRWRLLPGVW